MALYESLKARGMKQPLAQLISEGSPSAIPVPIADGGTGQTTKAAAFDALAPTTTRGDLIARSASSNGRIAVGAAQSFLGSDGTDPLWRSAANSRSDLGLGTAALVGYTEGTFTPAVTFGGGATGLTYTTRVGSYIKIGKLVNIVITIQINSNGTSTGDVAITGLPFTTANVANQFASINCPYWQGMSSIVSPIMAVPNVNATTMALLMGDATTAVTVKETNWPDNGEIILGGFYFAGA